MKTLLLAAIAIFHSEISARADELLIAMKGQSVVELADPDEVDWLRTHLVFVFDIAEHHCQEGSESHWKPSQKQIRDLIERVKRQNYLEMEFSTPTPITVESKQFLMKRLWVRIREKDWGTFDWAFETPEGKLVALSGIEGTYNRRLGPIIQAFVRDFGEQSGTDQSTTASGLKPDSNSKPQVDSEERSQ
ncbi:MAG: hypothetical protein AAGA58_00160 [Verrucomicrobiota bacterium]